MDNHWVQVSTTGSVETNQVFCLAEYQKKMVKPSRHELFSAAFAVHRYLEMPCHCAECAKLTERVGNMLKGCYKPA